jgi:hypothetical protein
VYPIFLPLLIILVFTFTHTLYAKGELFSTDIANIEHTTTYLESNEYCPFLNIVILSQRYYSKILLLLPPNLSRSVVHFFAGTTTKKQVARRFHNQNKLFHKFKIVGLESFLQACALP